MKVNKNWLIIGGLALMLILIVKRKSRLKKVDLNKNYVIGDSQTPFIDLNSAKVKRINTNEGEASLWKSGVNLNWLKEAVNKFPTITDVNSIVINIGTNGGFNQNDNVEGLVNSIKTKFPNAKLYVVKGSWGWGNNVNITEQEVNSYYNIFKNLGVQVIKTAIGKVNNPHSNLPVYAQIGSEIDNILN